MHTFEDSVIAQLLNAYEQTYSHPDNKKALAYFRQHGQFFTKEDWIKYPFEFPFRVVQKGCAYNAQILCGFAVPRRDESLKYYEGYLYTKNLVALHAWCVNADGKIIDPTAQTFHFEVEEFFGLEIDTDFFMGRIVKEKMAYLRLNEFLSDRLQLKQTHLL